MKRFVLFVSVSGFCMADAFDAGAVMFMIYPGARATGMGGAFTAVSDDPLCLYYNPGGLGLLESMEFHYQYAPWLRTLSPDAEYEWLGIVIPLPKNRGNIGFHYTYLTPGEIDVYDDTGAYRGSFWPYDWEAGLDYGVGLRRDFWELGLGGGFKYFYSFLVPEWVMREILGEAGGGSARTLAFDLGVLNKLQPRFVIGPTRFSGGLNLGLAFLHLGPSIDYTPGDTSKGDPIPYTMRVGLAFPCSLRFYLRDTSVFFGINGLYANDWNKVLVYFDVDLRQKGWEYILHEGFLSEGKELGIEFQAFRMRCGGRFWTGRFIDIYGWRIGPTWGKGFFLGITPYAEISINEFSDDTYIYEFNWWGDAVPNRRYSVQARFMSPWRIF
ncbi:MAG: PorV/PorQ family protein [candidate division WOR-3 bacterium]